MRVQFWLATVASVVGLCGAAQAEILASPPTYGGQGGPPNGNITCRIFNAGLGAANITARQIIANTNTFVAPASDTCNVPLGANQYCAFTAKITGNFAFTCRVTATGADVNLRGVAEVSTSGNVILNTLPMQ